MKTLLGENTSSMILVKDGPKLQPHRKPLKKMHEVLHDIVLDDRQLKVSEIGKAVRKKECETSCTRNLEWESSAVFAECWSKANGQTIFVVIFG